MHVFLSMFFLLLVTICPSPFHSVFLFNKAKKKNCLFPLQSKIGSVGRDFLRFFFYFCNSDETNFSCKCKHRKYIISDIYKFILQFYTRFMLFCQDISLQHAVQSLILSKKKSRVRSGKIRFVRIAEISDYFS